MAIFVNSINKKHCRLFCEMWHQNVGKCPANCVRRCRFVVITNTAHVILTLVWFLAETKWQMASVARGFSIFYLPRCVMDGKCYLFWHLYMFVCKSIMTDVTLVRSPSTAIMNGRIEVNGDKIDIFWVPTDGKTRIQFTVLHSKLNFALHVRTQP